LTKPLFDRRYEIISGQSLPTQDELTKGHEQEVKDKEEFSDDEDEEEAHIDDIDEDKPSGTLIPPSTK
jgi:hypothetical protein